MIPSKFLADNQYFNTSGYPSISYYGKLGISKCFDRRKKQMLDEVALSVILNKSFTFATGYQALRVEKYIHLLTEEFSLVLLNL